MKIAFVGKGGSGKTTLAALFTRFIAASAPDTALLAIDADINQHLAVALGANEDEAALLPALGDNLSAIKRCGLEVVQLELRSGDVNPGQRLVV